MTELFVIPFALQGICMLVDEFIFHRRRGLPLWEIWGHPLDTLTVLIPLGILSFTSYSQANLVVYICFSVLSCFFITKDEFIHARLCEPLEHWLHALLFVLHPVVFFAGALIWKNEINPLLLQIQFFVILGFLFYQVLYWGKPWKLLQQNPIR